MIFSKKQHNELLSNTGDSMLSCCDWHLWRYGDTRRVSKYIDYYKPKHVMFDIKKVHNCDSEYHQMA